MYNYITKINESISDGVKNVLCSWIILLCTLIGYGQDISVNILLDNNLSSHLPHLDEDGFYYIDLCSEDTLHLVAHGHYANNTPFDDATATFIWDLDDTTLTGTGLNTIDHHFVAGIGYNCSVRVTDAVGNTSDSLLTFRVRTSTNPISRLIDLPDICQGEPLDLTVGYDPTSYVQLQEIGNERITTLGMTDTVFLPDGKNCPPYGTSYRSPVTFTGFGNNSVINNVNDIFYVRLNIEHSAVADIKIQLVCPNGQSAIIQPDYQSTNWTTQYTPSPNGWPWDESYKAFTEMHLGEPFKANNNIEQTAGCDPADSPPGNGYNYIWSENSSQGYQYANSQNSYIYETANLQQTNNPNYNGDYGHIAYTVKASHPENNTQFYKPYQSFANLVGCPLNGEWYIEVKDTWEDDNGYVFEWELSLNPDLLPANWAYTVNVDTSFIDGEGANGHVITPMTSGNLPYTVHVIDEYGCDYDTITMLHVVPSPQPDLGDDVFICQDNELTLSITLDSNINTANTTYSWNTGDKTPDILVLSEGDYFVDVATTNDNGMTCIGSDTIHVGVYPSPIIDFQASEVEGCAPLMVRFTNNTTPQNTEFRWYLLYEGDEDNPHSGFAAYSSTLRTPSFKIEKPGIYSVSLCGTTPNGCSDTVIKWSYLKVYDQPIAEFEAEPEISMMSENDGEVHFFSFMDTTMADSSYHFQWNFDDGEKDTSTVSPIHTFAQWGDYDVTLAIETGLGCKSEITHTVVIEQDLIFPNVITPNGDNINDVFAIDNLNTNINEEDPDEYRTNDLYIYDRWGRKVYEAHNYDTVVKDGEIQRGNQIFDGTDLPDGVYYFSFYYKGKAKTINYNGSLTIIR